MEITKEEIKLIRKALKLADIYHNCEGDELSTLIDLQNKFIEYSWGCK